MGLEEPPSGPSEYVCDRGVVLVAAVLVRLVVGRVSGRVDDALGSPTEEVPRAGTGPSTSTLPYVPPVGPGRSGREVTGHGHTRPVTEVRDGLGRTPETLFDPVLSLPAHSTRVKDSWIKYASGKSDL